MVLCFVKAKFLKTSGRLKKFSLKNKHKKTAVKFPKGRFFLCETDYKLHPVNVIVLFNKMKSRQTA